MILDFLQNQLQRVSPSTFFCSKSGLTHISERDFDIETLGRDFSDSVLYSGVAIVVGAFFSFV